MDELPAPLRARLLAELNDGESICWAAQPIARRSMRVGFFLWLFFIPWTLMSAAFVVAGLPGSGAEAHGFLSLFVVLGVVFLLFGLVGLSLPYWMLRQARSTIYAVTPERGIVIEGARRITVKSYFWSRVSDVERKERADGSGHLMLAVEHYRDIDGDQTRQVGFEHIAEVAKLERLVQELVRAARA